nr:MAG TPA: hypothetical protein [Caudoviricetes sp.]
MRYRLARNRSPATLSATFWIERCLAVALVGAMAMTSLTERT